MMVVVMPPPTIAPRAAARRGHRLLHVMVIPVSKLADEIARRQFNDVKVFVHADGPPLEIRSRVMRILGVAFRRKMYHTLTRN
jgi:hypothetical protein